MPRKATARATGSDRPVVLLTTLFAGYPLWWMLGLSQVILMLAALVMLRELLRMDRVTLPTGFGWWLLFLVWSAAGVLLVQVDAPGGVPGGSPTRYFTWGYRFMWDLAGTVVLVYIVNVRRHVSTARLMRAVSWMFPTIVAGGVLGLVAPHLQLESLVELLLPHRIAAIPFVQAQIHPTVMELQDVLGYASPRPSAPFTYSNTWGLSFLCFLPFFVGTWWGRGAGWGRLVAPVVLAVSLVPVIGSLNRGMWFALVAVALFVAVRALVAGQPRAVLALVLAGLVLGAVLVVTPLGATIEARLNLPSSNQGRVSQGTLAVSSMVERSPVAGFGTTRQVQGSFDSIAGGASATCPRCSPPALGTQGRLWMLAFCTGLGGLAAYLVFFGLQVSRHLRDRSTSATVALSVLVAHLVTLPIYDWSVAALFTVMIAVALLGPPIPVTARRPGPLSVVRRRPFLLIALVVAGSAIGGVGQLTRGVPVTATVSLVLPADATSAALVPDSPEAPSRLGWLPRRGRPMTLDTAARMLAVPRGAGEFGEVRDRGLVVTALPNTRILEITTTRTTEAAARRSLSTRTDRFLRALRADQQARTRSELELLRTQEKGIDAAVATVDSAQRLLRNDTTRGRPHRLTSTRARLLVDATQVRRQLGRITSTHRAPAVAVSEVHVRRVHDGVLVAVVSGGLTGLCAGLLLMHLPGPGRRRTAPAYVAATPRHGFREPGISPGKGGFDGTRHL